MYIPLLITSHNSEMYYLLNGSHYLISIGTIILYNSRYLLNGSHYLLNSCYYLLNSDCYLINNTFWSVQTVHLYICVFIQMSLHTLSRMSAGEQNCQL